MLNVKNQMSKVKSQKLMVNSKGVTPIRDNPIIKNSGLGVFFNQTGKMRSLEKRKSVTGFTLIETIVAIGIMTTGISGGLALAVYALGASDVTLKEIAATSLAREGIEAVRYQRDRNWNECVNWVGCHDIGTDQRCCQKWDRDIPYSDTGTNVYVTYSGSGSWDLVQSNNWDLYRLYLHSSNGLYGGYGTVVNPHFYRRLTIYGEQAAPFTNKNPRLRIVSSVWWVGKDCPAPPPNPASSKCKVTLESYLTNWKDYESPL